MADDSIDEPTFSTQQLLLCVPGLTPEAFKQWINRGIVTLSDRSPVGKGKRRAHTATDIIQVAAIHELARQGILVSKTRIVWEVVEGRLRGLKFGLGAPPGRASVLFCLHPATGELVARIFDETDEDALGLKDEDAPDFAVLFRMDRFLQRVCSRMDAVKNNQPVPPPPNPTRNEDPDFFRRWDKDAEGRRVLVGLTAEETEEMEWAGAAEGWDHQARDRYLELHGKHEEARMARIMSEGGK